ncbi:hypothetical protein CMUS01_00291 [Colletotrichum musicola]|uniref:Uncharacterized protein n=1 Tax=Colletotrichum musicola TaxID=2175873 RepID=A0A8H6NZ07_9PEZI|nr:hypothetical protein CMUS01_00291 [Colletotrichum musicola]
MGEEVAVAGTRVLDSLISRRAWDGMRNPREEGTTCLELGHHHPGQGARTTPGMGGYGVWAWTFSARERRASMISMAIGSCGNYDLTSQSLSQKPLRATHTANRPPDGIIQGSKKPPEVPLDGLDRTAFSPMTPTSPAHPRPSSFFSRRPVIQQPPSETEIEQHPAGERRRAPVGLQY